MVNSDKKVYDFESSNSKNSPMRFMVNFNVKDESIDSKPGEMQLQILGIDLEDLKITEPKHIKFGVPFEKPWYNVNEKSAKNKLGKLYLSSLKMHSKDKERSCLCRIIDLERISAYTVESFENRLRNLLQIQGVEKFWFMPLGYYIDDKLKVTLFYPQSVSLY